MCNSSPITKNVLRIDFSNVHAHYVAWLEIGYIHVFFVEIHRVIGITVQRGFFVCYEILSEPQDEVMVALIAIVGNQL